MFENEIHELRKECLEWEKRAAFNRARTLEMISMRQSLLNQVDEKQMIVDEIKVSIFYKYKYILMLCDQYTFRTTSMNLKENCLLSHTHSINFLIEFLF